MHADVVDILIRAAPTTVDVKSQTGMTALRQSIWNDDVGVMDLLLQAGANSTWALHHAVLSGNLNVAAELVRRRPESLHHDDVAPIHVAALCGDNALISWLQTAGAEMSCRDRKGRMPIHMAAYYAQLMTLNFLVQNAADVEVQDESGKTALHYIGGATSFGTGPAAKKVMQLYSGKVKKFSGSAARASIAFLIDYGAKLSFRDKAGCTAIFYAALNGRINALAAFIGAGANVCEQDVEGATPMCYAAKGGQTKAIMVLQDAGASIKARDHSGQTAIFYAARNGHTRAIKTLYELSADVSSRDQEGNTPIFYAAAHNHSNAVTLLIDLGADPSTVNLKGETPRSIAAKGNNSAVVAVLDAKLAPQGLLLVESEPRATDTHQMVSVPPSVPVEDKPTNPVLDHSNWGVYERTNWCTYILG